MSKNSPVMMDTLESRTLLSASHTVRPVGNPPSIPGLSLPKLPAHAGPVTTTAYGVAQADIARLQADQTALTADAKAVRDAIAALLATPGTTLVALQTTVTADKALITADVTAIADVYKAHGPTIRADVSAVNAARKAHDAAALTVAKAQLVTDEGLLNTEAAAAIGKFRTDQSAESLAEKAVHDNVYNDATVTSAQAALTAATTTYKNDFATFLADRNALLSDIKNKI